MSANASFRPVCAKRRRKKAVHHTGSSMLTTFSGWVETGIALPIFVAANVGMCNIGAFTVSWSRYINPAVEAWQSTATSL
jgi:hypothetical protein